MHLFIDHKPISVPTAEGKVHSQVEASLQQYAIENNTGIHPNNETIQRMMEIKTFLQKNYRFHYSHDDLAREFRINKFKLKKEFKAVTSYNIHEYVTIVRMENAIDYLENTIKTISDIAKKVGLDKSNFIKQFKNHTGKKPTEWRNGCGLNNGLKKSKR